MITRFAYDTSHDPPAPVVPVRISGPAGEDAVMLPMLVDAGADCTLVPSSTIRRLGLPQIDVIALTGVGGARSRATVHAAAVEVGGVRLFARVVAFHEEAILGRDVLSQLVVTLDGLGLELVVGERGRGRSPKQRRKRAAPTR